MPRQANGGYLLPANTVAVSGTTITSTAYNALITDLGTEITNSVDRLGRSAMQANLPMGGNRATGAADPISAQDLATKAYVDAVVATFFSTGDVKPTLKNVADAGWILFDDGTFGSASSGSSSRSNSDTQALFTLFFTNLTDLAAPILTSGGGATTRAAQTNAATAWAANCRMSLPKMLGRALGAAGAGAGLTNRALGISVGEENHLLAVSEIPAHTHANTLSDPGHSHGHNAITGSTTTGGGGFPAGTNNGATISPNVTGITINNASIGGGGAHNNMQPTTFLNWQVRL